MQYCFSEPQVSAIPDAPIPYPNGSEVSASPGSTFARSKLDDPQKEQLPKTIDACQTYFRGNSLYFSYLNALRTLRDEPKPDAPDFMKNEAWRTKNYNTVLARLGTAETYLGVARKTGTHCRPGTFDLDYSRTVACLEKLGEILEGVETQKQLRQRMSELASEDLMSLELPYILMQEGPSEAERGSKDFFKEKQGWLETIAADIRNGRLERHPRVEPLLEVYIFDLEELWESFVEVSRELETITHKQLRGVDLNNSENEFVKFYAVCPIPMAGQASQFLNGWFP